MKHNNSIWNSLRVKLVLYSVASLTLAFFTEFLLVVGLYLMSTLLGVSRSGYGFRMAERAGRFDGTLYRGYSANQVKGILFRLFRLERSTLLTMLVICLLVGVVLFVVYFLLLTRGLTRDLSNISSRITAIAEGNLSERLDIKRQDEIGEIACRINEMTEEIIRLMEAEREALQTNKDLITCVAHDLRTPLTSVVGYLNLAMNVQEYPVEKRQEYARIALQKANRLEGLIQDLFSYTKLMSGEITLHRMDIDLVKLLEQMIEEFYPQFQENNLHYEFEKNTDSLMMDMDPDLIARAIGNLFSNAIKYGKDGKVILIALEALEQEVVLRVTNYGLIIPQESLDMIFEKFYRVEESRSRKTGGTGLGLNIAKEIIVIHGGDIAVESSQGEGTVFTIRLPYSQ